MTRIENENQYNWAVSRVEELLPLINDNTLINDPNHIELKLLSELVADYSEENYSIGTPNLIDILKLRMYEMKLNQTSLAAMLGISKSRISDYLNGRSEPTISIAREMSRKLNIDAAIVLGV